MDATGADVAFDHELTCVTAFMTALWSKRTRQQHTAPPGGFVPPPAALMLAITIHKPTLARGFRSIVRRDAGDKAVKGAERQI